MNKQFDRSKTSQTDPAARVAVDRIEEALRNHATVLNLPGLGLTKFPESIGQLTQLRSLNLSGNRLTALPESFRNLISLEELYLHGNSALGLPAKVVGPSWQRIVYHKAQPANPAEILEYYFRMRGGRQAVRLFYSYSHKDESLRNELETHLKLLQRQGLIETWHDRKIEAGEEWKQKIDDNLERADIILLLVSADFIASDYCYEIEMKRALERHEKKEARVIPVIVRDVNWRIAPFAKLQALPKDGKAVALWENKDSAWRNVSEGIERVIEEMRKKSGWKA